MILLSCLWSLMSYFCLIHEFNFLRFWNKGDVILLCGYVVVLFCFIFPVLHYWFFPTLSPLLYFFVNMHAHMNILFGLLTNFFLFFFFFCKSPWGFYRYFGEEWCYPNASKVTLSTEWDWGRKQWSSYVDTSLPTEEMVCVYPWNSRQKSN